MIQEDFARLAGVSRATLQNWESGRTEPPGRTLVRIRTLGGGGEKRKQRRYGEDTIAAAHTALDMILDNAPSEVVKKVQALLDKHAAQWERRE